VLDAHSRVDASLLQLEVLETATLGDLKRIAAIMEECNNLGVSFAIDDFGIGYGAVNSLRSLPVRSIKIDRSFIHNMLDRRRRSGHRARRDRPGRPPSIGK
jgi:EAL domain-containing protein (putative c-di-GMP-specific phosphodiesterase class I)